MTTATSTTRCILPTDMSTLDDYASHNTDRLSIPELTQVLLKLDFIQRHLQGKDGGTTEI